MAYCIKQFKQLCAQAFTPRPLKRLALVSHKSYYKTKPLEAALETAFDPDALLFGGTSQEKRSNIKVAVTSTAAIDNRPVILTNYNTGPEWQNDNREFALPSWPAVRIAKKCEVPYQVLRSPDPKTEFKVWEAYVSSGPDPLISY